MIGGEDIEIDILGPADMILDAAVKAILAYWPKAEFEDARSTEQFSSYNAVTFSRLEEVFVYKDHAALESWLELGADPSNANTMVHLLHGPTSLTVVVDDASAQPMASIIRSIRRALRDVCFGLRASGKAA